jgi:L-alanine-DL-glutamate epimerase-like enolase superfamily enzyme
MNTVRTLEILKEDWPIAGSFTISRGSRTTAHVVKVIIKDGENRGTGECVPYARYNETIESVVEQIESLRTAIESGITREILQKMLPAGAARNAIDCALWDLDAKRLGQPVWQLAGIAKPVDVSTAYTISLGTPEKMALDTVKAAERSVLKIKLGGDGDTERMLAVREAAPTAKLILDANESWDEKTFQSFMETAYEIKADLIEQPLPSSNDTILKNIERLIPVCADESLHTRAELSQLRKRYDCINIKLDKSGGLTEALLLKQEAEAAGFMIMIGCMVSTSLSMAPAMLLAQGAQFVDLDGPLLLAKDRSPAINYDGSTIFPPEPELWG